MTDKTTGYTVEEGPWGYNFTHTSLFRRLRDAKSYASHIPKDRSCRVSRLLGGDKPFETVQAVQIITERIAD